MDTPKIAIIIVFFNNEPDTNKLREISKENDIIIVDNTPERDLCIDVSGITYIPLKNNLGIAAAQNIGIKCALDKDCQFVIFFDQDSHIPENYAKLMLHEYERIAAIHTNLFILGPTVINGRTNHEYRSTIHRDSVSDNGFIERRDVISSGSIISLKNLNYIGSLDETLFIDYVDFDLCWRANTKGYVNGITTNVTLSHFVGQNEITVLNQLIIISSPVRYFYQMRNYLWLCGRSYVPMQWKFNTGLKKLFHLAVIPFKVKGWKLIYKNSFKGIISAFKKNEYQS